MKYVWIWMLALIDAVWLISSIVDVVRTVKYVKKHRVYSNVGDFVNCTIDELEEYTVQCVAWHILVLFVASLIIWIKFKTGGAE